MIYIRKLYKPFLYFLLILAAWAGFSLLPVDWSGWQPATCMASGGCFCEAFHPGSTAQPANTWSSLIYLLPGLVILTLRPSSKSLFFATPANRLIFGLALAVIGLGSAFYHASMTFVGQFFDVLGMYLLISFASIYRLAQLGRWSGTGTAAAYLGVNTALAGVLIGLPGIRREMFGALVAGYLVIELGNILRRRAALQLRWLGLALASLALAYVIWILDNSRVLCEPQSLLQGHAVWHILGALAAWFLFLYFQKENLP